MRFLRFIHSIAGRALWIAGGAALIAAGLQLESRTGLLLVMIGFAPIVIGLADMSVFDDVASAFGWRLTPRKP